MRPTDLKLSDLISAHGRKVARALHVAFPAKVTAVDTAANAVTVEPQLPSVVESLEGDMVLERLPVIDGVPICYPRSSRYGVTFPIDVGDYVLVVCCDRNVSEWLRTASVSDPLDAGIHPLDGAVAIPGVYPLDEALGTSHLTDHMTIGALTGATDASIHIRPSEIRLGDDTASDFVALAQLVSDALTTLKTALTTGAIDSDGAIMQAGLVSALATWPPSVAAQKVKAK